MSKGKVLLVDDDADFLAFLQLTLKRRGYEVTATANVREAQDHLGKEKFSLVISDYLMPQLNGLKFFEWIRDNSPTPFILMTGYSEINTTAKAHGVGMSGFLSKPFQVRDLNDMIESVLGHQAADAINGYFAVPLSIFVRGFELPYAVFVNANKVISHVTQPGEILQADKIAELRSQAIESLYVRNEHFSEFMHFHLSLCRSEAASRAADPSRTRLPALEFLIDLVTQRLGRQPLDAHVFASAKMALELFAQEGLRAPVPMALSLNAGLRAGFTLPEDLPYWVLATALIPANEVPKPTDEVQISTLSTRCGLAQVPERERLQKVMSLIWAAREFQRRLSDPKQDLTTVWKDLAQLNPTFEPTLQEASASVAYGRES